MEIHFATSNKHKYSEASSLFGQAGIPLRHLDFRHREIRSDSLEEIAHEAAEAAFAECGKPVFVEDTGLFIDALDGFPGTYSGWVLKKIGCAGMLRLLEGIGKREARFQAVIALNYGKGIKTFMGVCKGEIAHAEAGDSGFGYDPLFIPAGHSQTFAQNIGLKNKLSHRYNSLLELLKFIKEAHF
jgi:XTP/dITP diphosphohydrolase